MSELNFKLNKNNFIKYFIFFVITLIILNAVFFGFEVHSKYIRSDMWRYVEMYLYPIYQNGNFNWRLLWEDQHSQPLTALTFIINSLYFNLSINLFFYIGIVSKILVGILLIWISNKVLLNYKWKYIVFLVIILHFFSIRSVVEYGWPLVLRANLWYFIMLIILLMVDKKNLKIFFLLTFLLVFINKSFSLVFIIALSFVLIIIYLIEKKNYIFKYIILMFIAILSLKIFFLLFDIQPHSPTFKFNINNLSLKNYIDFFSLGLASGVINVMYFKKIFGEEFVKVFGYIYFAFYIFIIIFYFKLKLYKKTIVPISLMFFSLSFILAVSLFRYFPNEKNLWLIVSPRYTKAFEIGFIGFYLSFVLILLNINFSYLKRVKNLIILLFSLFMIFVNIYNIIQAWRMKPYIIRAQKKAQEEIYKNYFNPKIIPPKFAVGKSFSHKKVEFLYKYKLNVFSNNYFKDQK